MIGTTGTAGNWRTPLPAQYSHVTSTCQPTAATLVDKCRSVLERWFWPSTCVLCRGEGQAGIDLCRACESDLPFNIVACEVCAQPLVSDAAMPLVCGRCQQRPPRFQSSFAPLRYTYPVDRLIQGLKFRRELACGRVLGELFTRRLLQCRNSSLPQLIIPVPLAPRRYRERGYNQATELSRAMQRLTGIRVRTDLVVRSRDTLAQTALDQKERRRNVRGAFAVVAKLPASHIAIVDDVVTTGSTVAEVARVLRRAGAKRIEVWAVARAGNEGAGRLRTPHRNT